ncbi:MAG TPA: hypothetical protein VHD33_01880 [Legionellaceae bacterium]|nr:hypothetical protein [Legionellaceae bacterium]
MKKSTLAIATLLTALSVSVITPVAYADDAPTDQNTTTPSTGNNCSGCSGCNSGESTPDTTGTGSDS